MTEQTPTQSGVGKTGGLPGQNADPRMSELSDDERDETVAMADVARPEEDEARGEQGRGDDAPA
jgi:hypothetical protein